MYYLFLFQFKSFIQDFNLVLRPLNLTSLILFHLYIFLLLEVPHSTDQNLLKFLLKISANKNNHRVLLKILNINYVFLEKIFWSGLQFYEESEDLLLVV